MQDDDGWKRFGRASGPGIPAPTGQFAVGCVDLMHKLEGDNDGLLVRLFYPTLPMRELGRGHQYAKWVPNKQYLKGHFVFNRSWFPGLMTFVTSLFLDPHMPALEKAPLHPETEPTSSTEADDPPVGEKLSEGVERKSGTATEQAQLQQQLAEPAQDDHIQLLKPFPVVVFSHGLSAIKTISSGICCDVVSHGYVVASVEHRDGSGGLFLKRVPKPGGREGDLVDEWVEYQRPESERNADFDPQSNEDVSLRNELVKKRCFDVKQALNIMHLLNNGGDIQNMLEGGGDFDFSQFKGRLDVERAAVIGHSFGGSTTVQVMCDEPRFKCGIALDGWMIPFPEDYLKINGLSTKQPLLFINSDFWQWKENVQSMVKLLKSCKERGNESCSIITLKGSDHFDQTDLRFVMPPFASRKLPAQGRPASTIDPLVAHQLNLDLCHSFLKRHLLKDPAYQQNVPNLDGGIGCSEHVFHGTTVDLSPAETVVQA